MPFIQIYMVEGRTVEQKRELAEVLTKEVARIAKADPHAVHIHFFDLAKENMADAGILKINQ